MANDANKARKGGKRNRKFSRNGRAPSNKMQARRTDANKARRKDKANSQRSKDAKKGFVVDHGATRAKKRSKDKWVKAMSTAKAKKAEARRIAEAAQHGGHILALPTAQSLAIVAAWQRAKDARNARAEANRNKLVKG